MVYGNLGPEASLLGHDDAVTSETGDRWSARYWRALDASRELTRARRAAAEAGERRLTSEDAVDERLRTLNSLSGFGPATWWLRLRGQLADRQAPVAEEVRRTAVEHLSLLQERADDLPAAREAAVGSIVGPDGDVARGGLS